MLGHWWRWPIPSCLAQSITRDPSLLFHLFRVPCPAWGTGTRSPSLVLVWRVFISLPSSNYLLTTPAAQDTFGLSIQGCLLPAGQWDHFMTESWLITLPGNFRDHHLLLQLSLLPLLLCHSQCHPDHDPWPGLILSWSKGVESQHLR